MSWFGLCVWLCWFGWLVAAACCGELVAEWVPVFAIFQVGFVPILACARLCDLVEH